MNHHSFTVAPHTVVIYYCQYPESQTNWENCSANTLGHQQPITQFLILLQWFPLPCCHVVVFLHMTKLIFKAVTRNHAGRIYCTRGAQQPVSVETLLQHFRSDKLFPLQRARQLRSQEAC